jgi:hypothetical protein
MINFALAATLAVNPLAAPTGYLWFYEGANATQNLVCSIPVPRFGALGARQIDFTNDPYGCANDEARSVSFVNVDAGLSVQVWDRSSCANPFGVQASDVSYLDLAAYASYTIVGTFERSTGQVRGLPYTETYVRANGNLDGKVSCIRISRSR